MFFHNINYWTVLIAGVATLVVGGLWYSPILFLKPFIKEMGKTMEAMEATRKTMTMRDQLKMYVPTFALALVSAFVVSALLNSLVITSIGGLITLAISTWAAFSLPVASNNTVFGDDSFKLTLINTGYQLVNILVVTLIIGIWG